MLDYSKLKDDLRRDEGVRFKPYRDTAGKLTIGCGRNLDDVGISPAEADLLLTNDIAEAVRGLDIAFPAWRGLSEARQRALVNMMFNLGMARFMGFRKMLAAIRAGDFKAAAREALDSDWKKQVGARAYRIAELIENG